MCSIPDLYTTQRNVTVAGEMFSTSRHLITYSLKICAIFNLENTVKCILHVLLRYKDYSQKDSGIGEEQMSLSSTNRSCGTFVLYFHRSLIQHQISQVHKLHMTIFASPKYNVYIRYLNMKFSYSIGCYGQGVVVASYASKTILSKFCGEYDAFDRIYMENKLDIQLFCSHSCSTPYLRIRYQPTHRLRVVPHNLIVSSDIYRIRFERSWVANKIMFWVRAPFYNMIHIVTQRKIENITIFDGPTMDCAELKGKISSTFEILIYALLHNTAFNICYVNTATPENAIFSDILITVESKTAYRVYSAPKGFESIDVTIAGLRGEACNLGGIVFLQYDDYTRWNAIGPYCGTSFSDISVQNHIKSGIVIYSYGEVKISLHITSSTRKTENVLMHMAPGDLPFIAEFYRYHFGENVERLTILPKPWNYGKNVSAVMLLHLANKGDGDDHVKGFRRLLPRRLISISMRRSAVKFLNAPSCNWWIETSSSDSKVKGYLSKYLSSGRFDSIEEYTTLRWGQNCSPFPYPIIIDFQEIANKTTYVYREPRRPYSDFVFTNIDKKYSIVFHTLRPNQTHHIRVTAHSTLIQIWEVAKSNCKFARVSFSDIGVWMQSVTLDASKPQRLPSGHRKVSFLKIKNESPSVGNFSQESCNLTLHAISYLRQSLRTDPESILLVRPFIMCDRLYSPV